MALTKIGKEGITGISNSSDATAITISSDEHVLIGTTTDGTTANGTVIRDAGEVLITRTDNPPLLLNRANSTGVVAEIRQANTAVGYISANSGGMGVYLGGTNSANHLDDYEEGTWTPIYEGAGSNPTISYLTQSGTYIKLGALVHVQGRIRTNSTSGGSGNLLLGGLPFTTTNASEHFSTLHVAYTNNWAADNFPASMYSNNGSATFFINHGRASDFRDGVGILVTTSDLTNASSSNDMIFSGTYATTQ